MNPDQNVVAFTPSNRVRRYSYGSVATLALGGFALVTGAFMLHVGAGLVACAWIARELSASLHQGAQLHMQNEFNAFVAAAKAEFEQRAQAEQGSRNPFARVTGQGIMPVARVN